MGDDNGNSFFCPCCEREKPSRMLSDTELEDKSNRREPLCAQCASFLSMGLPNLAQKIANQGKRAVPVADVGSQPATTRNALQSKIQQPQKIDAAKSKPKRSASASERSLFGYKCQALEKYIEGFIKGLEAAGLDRSAFDDNMTNAINSLLSIGQKLSAERIQVSSEEHSRSDVRRLTRHMDETSPMVEEYVTAIVETLERSSASRPPRSR